jgi:hypothetical protein
MLDLRIGPFYEDVDFRMGQQVFGLKKLDLEATPAKPSASSFPIYHSDQKLNTVEHYYE